MAPIDELSLIEDILFEINLMFDIRSDYDEIMETMIEIYGMESLDEIQKALEIFYS